jgi:hypothetical protein
VCYWEGIRGRIGWRRACLVMGCWFEGRSWGACVAELVVDGGRLGVVEDREMVGMGRRALGVGRGYVEGVC